MNNGFRVQGSGQTNESCTTAAACAIELWKEVWKSQAGEQKRNPFDGAIGFQW
jgi:hypothetical protein